MGFVVDTSYIGGIRTANYSTEKLLVFNNQFTTGTATNDSGDAVVLPIGTIMGRVASSGELIPLQSDAEDGSQYPVGLLLTDYSFADGESKSVQLVVAGEVNANLLSFAKEGDDLDTVIEGKQLRDRLAGDTVGLNLRFPDELSKFDN